MELDEKGYKISTFEIIKLMSEDKENPIEQIIYVGSTEKFDIFKEKHQLEKANFIMTPFIPFEQGLLSPSSFYGFTRAIIVIEDCIYILLNQQDKNILKVTNSQIVKNKDFPHMWFKEYWERTFKKEENKITNRFSIMEIDP